MMYVWDVVEERDHPNPMGSPEFDTSPNMKIVRLRIRLTTALWSTGKAAIMGIGFCVLKGLFRMRKRGVYGISWIKRGNIGLGEFMEMALSITLGKNILVVCDVFVVNGMRYILIYIFLNNPDDNRRR